MANIERYRAIDPAHLSGEFYFSTLLQEAYQAELISAAEVEAIQMRCLELLAVKTEQYTGGDSSIRTEIAERLLKSCIYTLGIALKAEETPELAVETLKTLPIPELYQRGRKRIDARLHASSYLYTRARRTSPPPENNAYLHTLRRELPAFFKGYNAEYAAHELPTSFSYPLCTPPHDLAGVEFLQSYLQGLCCENEFCRCFEAEELCRLADEFSGNDSELLYSLFELAFTTALGCVMVGHNPLTLSVTREELHALFAGMSPDEVALQVDFASDKLFAATGYKQPSLKRYMQRSLPQLTANILRGVQPEAN